MNNQIKVKGILNLANRKTFTSYDERFCECKLEVKRKSGVIDFITIVISEKLVGVGLGPYLEILGEIRTRNEITDGKSKLIIFVFAKELKLLDAEEYANEVELRGFLCKQPILRTTPLSNRKICDALIALNNRYGKSYYIPTIIFNRDAVWTSELPIGIELMMSGRLQSRVYTKEINGNKIEKYAIELCVKNINKINKGELQ